jgi:hypothetical protein
MEARTRQRQQQERQTFLSNPRLEYMRAMALSTFEPRAALPDAPAAVHAILSQRLADFSAMMLPEGTSEDAARRAMRPGGWYSGRIATMLPRHDELRTVEVLTTLPRVVHKRDPLYEKLRPFKIFYDDEHDAHGVFYLQSDEKPVLARWFRGVTDVVPLTLFGLEDRATINSTWGCNTLFVTSASDEGFVLDVSRSSAVTVGNVDRLSRLVASEVVLDPSYGWTLVHTSGTRKTLLELDDAPVASVSQALLTTSPAGVQVAFQLRGEGTVFLLLIAGLDGARDTELGGVSAAVRQVRFPPYTALLAQPNVSEFLICLPEEVMAIVRQDAPESERPVVFPRNTQVLDAMHNVAVVYDVDEDVCSLVRFRNRGDPVYGGGRRVSKPRAKSRQSRSRRAKSRRAKSRRSRSRSRSVARSRSRRRA